MFPPITLNYIRTIHQVIIYRVRAMVHSPCILDDADKWDQLLRDNREIDSMLQYLYELYDTYLSMECVTEDRYQEAREWLMCQVNTYLCADTVVRRAMRPFQTFDDYLDEMMNLTIDMHAMSKQEYHKAMQDWENELSRNRLRRMYERQERHKLIRNTIVYASMMPEDPMAYLDATPFYDYIAHLPPKMIATMETDPHAMATYPPSRMHRERVAVTYMARCLSSDGH
jgi:hypothetical protein